TPTGTAIPTDTPTIGPTDTPTGGPTATPEPIPATGPWSMGFLMVVLTLLIAAAGVRFSRS
ncbi:MAG TPA: glycoside hydrolase, partial [bacterium]|nr:glycoside hydrolase [bacterium]